MSAHRDTPQPVLLADYRPPAFLIGRLALRFEIEETETRVAAALELRRNPAGPSTEGVLHLDGEGLELRALALNGAPLTADRDRLEPGGLTLFGVPDRFRLESEVVIHPETNSALEGLYRSNGLFCTQCEAEGSALVHRRPDVLFIHGPDFCHELRTE